MFGLIAGILTMAVMLYIGMPLLAQERSGAPSPAKKPRKSSLVPEKQAGIEREMQEVEFDYRVGKLSQADFEIEHARLQESLTRITQKQKAPARKAEKEVDALEEEIARRREERKRQGNSP